MPPGGYPGTRPGVNIASQFSGMALWSIILGVLSVGVPLATGIFSGTGVFYFYILPIFGFVRGVQAITRGQMIGGIIGIVLNILGGLMSLIASGVLSR
jgi:phage-related minor tail protein